ncbi:MULTISPECIES: hypothetical protein [unclassified Helicobacter]|uniref:hypothetical protein n=1 Tax=unclassified Helicobacter TaxID=2593540 RepID=UPI000CF161A9|nr:MULTISPECIES: hypothetical protein [unclassified Helicobacter]
MSKVFLIKDNKIGEGELGEMVMGGFLHTVSLQEALPKTIMLLNKGVLLADQTRGNKMAFDALKKMQECGVEIVLCQTCVEYFELQQQNLVGRIDDAVYITQTILNNEVVSL